MVDEHEPSITSRADAIDGELCHRLTATRFDGIAVERSDVRHAPSSYIGQPVGSDEVATVQSSKTLPAALESLD
jgi:hypothetical protein